jgi:hypothetical protein
MQLDTPLNGAGSAAVGSLTSATRYRPEITAANSAGLWQVRDLQSGLRRWLRYLGEGPAGATAAATAQLAQSLVAARPYALGLVRTDSVDGQQVALFRWLGETTLATENLDSNAAYYALQLLDAAQDLAQLPQPIALPQLASAQLLVVANAQRLRLSDFSAAVVNASADELAATRTAVRRLLGELVSTGNSAAARYAELASAWENDAAVYPDLRLALAQLRYGQLLAQ